jgi:hypothetical protein
LPDSNINAAIKACTEQKSDVFQTREQMKMVKEAQNEGYCDPSGYAGKLSGIGMRMHKIFMALSENSLQVKLTM